MSIEIREVTSKSSLYKFIRFPFSLYKNNPYWVPSLDLDEKRTLSKDKNPAFEFCEARYWIALKEGKIVGRIAGIINHRANECWKENRIRFGWIDFIDDIEVAKALLSIVEDWGKERGFDEIHGPLGFTDMDREGMLVEGFNEYNTYANIYNYPYYPTMLESLGYRKDIDWLQFEFNIPKEEPQKLKQLAQIVSKRYNLHTLKDKTKKKLKNQYASQIFAILNESFRPLYGFAPLSEKQIELFTNQYIGYVDPEYISCVMDHNDNMLGFGITMPSLTKAVQKTKGKLFPFGWYHILRSVKKSKIVDMYLIAIKPEWQNKGLNALIFDELMKNYIKNGIEKAVQNPILENNSKNIDIWKEYSPRQFLRRRCYIKKID